MPGEFRVPRRISTPTELRVLDAVRRCCERWGFDKVTVDDIARESGVSRATLYRMFPGGKDVIFEALRVHELDEFFVALESHLDDATTLDELLTRAVAEATRHLHEDEHLAAMLATEPGAVVSELTVEGLPRIISVASAYLLPYVERYLPHDRALPLIDVVVRLVISYFLSPSPDRDLTEPAAVRSLIAPLIDAAAAITPSPAPTAH